VSWLPSTVSNRATPVNSRAPSPRWLDGNEMVESAGTAPAASILQGSTAPLCTPRIGVQSQCRPDLPGFSNRCFHWISFLDGELRNALLRYFGADQRNRTAINARAAHGTPNIPGPRILTAICEFRSLSQNLPEVGGEPRNRTAHAHRRRLYGPTQSPDLALP
jgi:hypothetical protein